MKPYKRVLEGPWLGRLDLRFKVQGMGMACRGLCRAAKVSLISAPKSST